MSKDLTANVALANDPSALHIHYRYDVKKELLDDPDQIGSVRVFLPSGLSAKFIRLDRWEEVTPLSNGPEKTVPPPTLTPVL
jgi:hypothetical protein